MQAAALGLPSRRGLTTDIAPGFMLDRPKSTLPSLAQDESWPPRPGSLLALVISMNSMSY